MSAAPLSLWHAFIESGDLVKLDALLADDVTFHSPIVHTPQRGKALAKMYLTAAFELLRPAHFEYVREVAAGNDAILEFVAEIDGIRVNGVDMIHWNAAGEIEDFKVMIRPLKAVNRLHAEMGKMLEQLAPKA